MLASIVVRTYNEERHLGSLLGCMQDQLTNGIDTELIVVDSGSKDRTIDIAKSYSARIERICKNDFSFGRSLNLGCSVASGEYLVFISGHCQPTNEQWLAALVAPLNQGHAVYSYGRQIGNGQSKFSECQLFRKYYSETSQIPQDGFFCNNANAALLRSVWERFRFCEEVTGLEDMELGSRLVNNGLKLAYTADAAVYHMHDETWLEVRNRYEREAIALQRIMPQVQVNLTDFLRYFGSAVLLDWGAAMQQRSLLRNVRQIVMFRLMQFWGTYRGNHMHRVLSKEMKEKYFYPR